MKRFLRTRRKALLVVGVLSSLSEGSPLWRSTLLFVSQHGTTNTQLNSTQACFFLFCRHGPDEPSISGRAKGKNAWYAHRRTQIPCSPISHVLHFNAGCGVHSMYTEPWEYKYCSYSRTVLGSTFFFAAKIFVLLFFKYFSLALHRSGSVQDGDGGSQSERDAKTIVRRLIRRRSVRVVQVVASGQHLAVGRRKRTNLAIQSVAVSRVFFLHVFLSFPLLACALAPRLKYGMDEMCAGETERRNQQS